MLDTNGVVWNVQKDRSYNALGQSEIIVAELTHTNNILQDRGLWTKEELPVPGNTFTWGKNDTDYNAYDIYDEDISSTQFDSRLPPASFEAKAVLVACGSHHTLVVTEQGTLWSYGMNYAGQLGTGDDKNKIKHGEGASG